MKILTSKTLPSPNELAETLKRRFSDRYSFKLRGLGQDKNVIVQKSSFDGLSIPLSRSPWKKLEMEIGSFLKQEYN